MEGVIFPVTEVAFITRAVPRGTCGDILCIEVGMGKQLIRQQVIGVSLTNSLKYRPVVEISSSWA
jgi:hypothetical protein